MKAGNVKVYIILFIVDEFMFFHSAMVVSNPEIYRDTYALINPVIIDCKKEVMSYPDMISASAVMTLISRVIIDKP